MLGCMGPRSYDEQINELALAIGLLVRRIRSTAPSEVHDLSWTQKAVIGLLDKEGAMTTAQLARAQGVTPQSMGSAVLLLEQIGFVERKPHPLDGRQFNIRLTARGSTMRRTTRQIKQIWLSQAIASLDKDEQATLFAAGEIISRLAQR